jgi:beta-phosphoglucomutase-like phosphatase (HAD superfamily)
MCCWQIFAGDVVAKKKPAPDIYNLAKDTMGLDPTR